MKLHFDPNLTYQTDAVNAVCDLFRGQETCRTEFTVTKSSLFDEALGIGNRLSLLDDQILANLRDVQLRNGLKPTDALASGDFTVEMETGTGQTRPIVIVDEPQSVDGGLSGAGKTALGEMSPLCTLRYSATHVDKHHMVWGTQKCVFESVVYDSATERDFAQSLEDEVAVKIYTKLPRWFQVKTPLGSYNPDWAVVIEEADGDRLYFVVETKGSLIPGALRATEAAKIDCGKAHFESLSDGTDSPAQFRLARALQELLTDG